MHSHNNRWTTISAMASALIAAAFIAPGCRGSKPFGRLVKVTQKADTDQPYVDPPEQRLATSLPSGASENIGGATEVTMTAEPIDPNSSEKKVGSTNPGNFAVNRQQEVNDRSASRSDRNTLQQDIVRRVDSSRDANRTVQKRTEEMRDQRRSLPSPQVERLASQRTKTQKAANQRTANQRTTQRNSVDTNDIQQPSVANAKQPAADAPHSELLNAFADYPPEVQREALRRLVAATSKSAKKTDQPSGFDSELQKQAQHLPELPPARNSAADVPATRLGTEQNPKPRRSSSVVTVADQSRPHEKKPVAELATQETTGRDLLAQQQKAAQQKIAAMTNRVSNLATGVLEPAKLDEATAQASDSKAAAANIPPVVASVGDLPSDVSQGSVQPASASRPTGEADNMIARAAPERSVASSKAGEVPRDVDSFSDEQLYRALVKQLSTAPQGESETQRSSRLIKLRHLMVLSGDVDAAVKKIEGMSESEQEFLRHQLLGLWTMVDPGGHPVASRRITTALPQLRQATQFAAAATDSLEVRSVSFCSEIESYGQIKPFKSNRFDAGQQVILYCEIENFSAKKSDEGYVTEMQGSYDIFDSNNQKVVSQLLPADRQVSSNYLRDYYIAYQMHLPKQLPAGKYRLQLTMEDVGGKKYGQSSIDLAIGK